VRSRVDVAKKFLPDIYDYQVSLLESDAKLRLIVKGRQIGISTLIAVEALVDCLITKGFTVVMLSAREDSAIKLLNEARKLLKEAMNETAYSDLVSGDDNKTVMEFDNGSRIIALPCANTEASRGYTVDHLVFDEFGSMAKVVDTDDLWAAALPTITLGGKLTVVGTPAGKGNKFYQLYKEAEGFEKWEIPWHRCPRQTEEGLALIREEMSKRPGLFEQEYECSWEGVSAGNDWTLEEIETLLLPSVEGKGTRLAGYDPAEKKHRSIFMVLEVKGKEKRVLHQENLAKMSYPEQAKRIAQLVRTWGVTRLCFDVWGIGEGVKHELKKVVSCKLVPKRLKKEDKQSLYVRIKSDADREQFAIIDEGQSSRWLMEDLAGFDVNNGNFIETHSSHMDSLSALMLAYSDLGKNKSFGTSKFTTRQYRTTQGV